MTIRIVRSDGTVEHDWEVSPFQSSPERVVVRKWDDRFGDYLVKAPRRELFDHWQLGGTARSTKDLDA